MDLYDDLPPALGDKTEDKGSSNLANDSSIAIKSSGNTDSVKELKAKSTLCNQVLFKPRQTKFLPSSVPTSSVRNLQAVASTENKKEKSFIDNHLKTSNESAITIEPHDGASLFLKSIDIIPSTVKEEKGDDIVAEFNTNTGFEVLGEIYDPSRPNDYLAYCEERLENKRIQQLAAENKRQLEEQLRAREEMERNRQEAVEKRDFQKLLQSSQAPLAHSGGRGRGGMLNLPAWLTQQMTSDSTELQGSDLTGSSKTDNQPEELEEIDITGLKRKALIKANRPSTVLLLTNMVNISDVDDSLAKETKSECERFGDVVDCVIHVVNNKNIEDVERVRVFIRFKRQDAAIRACRDMHGRMFGGRQVSASFYDEDRFLNRLLDPDSNS